MKKFFAYVAVALMIVMTATNCSKKDEVTYDDLKLSVAGQNLAVREGENISFDIKAGSGEYEVLSSNNAVIKPSLSQTKVVLTGVAEGEATVTVLDKKTNQRATVKIAVSKGLVDLALDVNELTLYLGENKVANISSGNGEYEVSISDSTIATATLSQTTVVVGGVSSGTTTVKVKDKASNKEVTLNVIVTEKQKVMLSESSIIVKAFTTVEIEKAKEMGTTLDDTKKVSILSGSGSYQVTSSDDKIAKVDLSGNELIIKGISSGVATITVSNEVDNPAILEVKVYNLIITPDGLNLTPNEVTEVTITEGSGQYEFVNNNSSLEVNQTEDKLIVKGIQATENAEIVVRDVVSGKEAVLAVRVTQSMVIPTEEDVVFVEGGTFIMGSSKVKDEKYPEKKISPYSDKDEVPLHKVTLSSYKISKYEITNSQYAKFLNAEDNKTEGGLRWYYGKDIVKKEGQYTVVEGRESYPVTFVTWYGARAYAKWAGGSLPTEAQWEYAALGGKQSKGYLYAGSDDVNEVAFHIRNSKGVNPVGLKKPNELGIYDMSGNVWEWTADRYAPYKEDDQVDPEPVTESTDNRFIRRGASVYCKPTYCRSANRGAHNSYQNNIGFRVVFKE